MRVADRAAVIEHFANERLLLVVHRDKTDAAAASKDKGSFVIGKNVDCDDRLADLEEVHASQTRTENVQGPKLAESVLAAEDEERLLAPNLRVTDSNAADLRT